MDCPRARLLAIENTSAVPTRNENDGWIMSCSTQPVHSTCDWCWQSSFQTGRSGADSGKAEATAQNRSTSAIMRNITSPR